MEEEVTDDILTFDEILGDPVYKAEFDRRVAEAININSHSDVKGGINTMNDTVQTPNEGEEKTQGAAQAESQPSAQPPEATENPAVENTDAAQDKAKEPTREMTAEQFDLYNETLRRVSKTAKASLPDRYNAFEDSEIKALVEQQVMDGNTPNIKELAASVVTRLTPAQEPPQTDTQAKQSDDEVLSLKAEIALLKAGVTAERIDAAKKLFIAEGGDLSKVAEFVAKYPEWQQAQEGRVVFSKAPPLAGKTAPTPDSPPVLNDFERAVAAARKKAGLE